MPLRLPQSSVENESVGELSFMAKRYWRLTESLENDSGTSSTDHVTYDDVLRGTGVRGQVLTITMDGAVIGTTVVSRNGDWRFDPTNLADGTHTAVAHPGQQPSLVDL